MAEPRHLAQQAVGKADKAHMAKTDEDRRSEAADRAAEQFGDPAGRVSPDVYPDYSGDITLTPRDQADNEAPNGQSARASATTADDHKEKVGKDGLTPSAKESVKPASSSTSKSSSSSSSSS